MASTELIVDDEYCRNMGNYFLTQGEQLDKCISDYLRIMNKVKDSAIVSGEASKALAVYISKVTQLKGKIKEISSTARNTAETFVTKVDAEDKELY